MIVFVYGTTAEAIKIAPVVRRLADRGVAFEQWVTLQQSETVLTALPGLGLPAPDHVLARGRGGRPLQGQLDVLVWLGQVLRWVARNGGAARRQMAGGVLVVHGDTLTSVVGALLARYLRCDCAHLEAGLRSGDWRSPFPEELDRRIVGRLAQVHYAPSDAAVAALGRRPGVVHTRGNTVLDALTSRVPAGAEHALAEASDGAYGLVLLHRFEFLNNAELVERTFATLLADAPDPFVIVVDDHARHSLQDLLGQLPRDRVRVTNKLDHDQFVKVLAEAAWVVTDSGGVQEETALLGVPTLVHRRATERADGLGDNAVLSGWQAAALRAFLAGAPGYRRPPRAPGSSPSDVVVEDLLTRYAHS